MLPRVIIHNGASLDGRMDWSAGDLEADMGLYYGLAARLGADTMLSGSRTMLTAYAQTPPLQEETFEPPVQEPNDSRPRLVVVDSRGQIRNWTQIRLEPYWREPVALCSKATPQAYLEYVHKRHIGSIVAGEERVDLRAALIELQARYGVQVIRVDSGGVLNGALLRAGLVSEVSVIVNPCLVGGTSPRSIFVAPDLTSSEGVIRLKLIHYEQVQENTLWLRYQVIQ